MNAVSAEFIAGASKPEHFPNMDLPEFAFAGRSNVGKSSLLNDIVFRKNLARISSNPGKTQQINFYLVDEKWIFADLPGFGYAVIAKTQRQEWADLNFNYIENRKNLKMLFYLVDGRHEPMAKDLGIIEKLEMLEQNYLIIMTKCDKISSKLVNERKEQFEYILKNCNFCHEVLPYSIKTGLGREHLHAIINRTSKLKKEKS